MRRGVIWVFLSCLVVTSLAYGQSALADDYSPWVVSELAKVSELATRRPTSDTRSCATNMLTVEVADGGGGREACVYGDAGGERMARYRNPDGQYAYAFSYRSDHRFYPLGDFCRGVSWCVYSQAEDVAVGFAGGTVSMVARFSAQLQRRVGAPTAYVVPRSSEQPFPFSGASSGLSNSGRWTLVEVPQEGVVRIDMRTGTYRWIALHSVRGANSATAPLDLAISDDGKQGIIAGWYGSVQAHEITDRCGYEGGAYRTYGYVSCQYHELEVRAVTSGFQHIQNIRYSQDGMSVTATVSAQQG